MAVSFRLDAVELRPMRRDVNGFLRGDAFVSKVGVFEYFRDGRIYKEFRSPEEVFHPESLASMELAPVTLGHPSTSDGLLKSPKEADGRVVGAAGNPTRLDSAVRASMLIHASDAVAAIEAGIRQISPGYKAEYFEKPGTYNGQSYDGIQTNIRYNHHAIVPLGRQGGDVGMRLDSIDGYSTQLIEQLTGNTMKLTIGDDSHDVPDALHASLHASVEKLRGKLAAVETLTAARIDAAQIPLLVNARVQRVLEAQKIIGDAIPLEKLVAADEDELLRAMCASLDPTVKLDGQSTDFVRGLLSMLSKGAAQKIEEKKAASQGLVELARAAAGQGTRTDAAGGESDLAKDQKNTDDEYLKMVERSRNAWKSSNANT